jgi:N-sulfoglucosamine sulfohydrolase
MTAVSFYELLADSFYTQEEKSSRRAGWRRKSERKIRDAVFFERERHALGRSENGDGSGMLSYPIRGIRTKEYLYLINLRPHLWPACDPPDFKDVDPSPSKSKILSCQNGPDSLVHYFELSCGKRPQEELYDLSRDPYQLNNLAGDFKYRRIKRELWWRVKQWMADTSDPRAEGEDDRWDNYEWSPFTQTSKPRQ